MKLLTRSEELILLSVWRLKNDAYSVLIRDELIRATGKKWSFGAVFDPLDRLERNGLLESYLTEPTAERGGRSKRIYSLTVKAKTALADTRIMADALWEGIPLAEFKKRS